MDLKIISLHRYCVQAAFILLAACGSSPQQETVADAEAVGASNYYVGKDAVYANLVSGSGGSWIFDKVTESDLPSEKGYIVRLNDLAPAFDTRVAECTPQAYPTNHKCNPAHPFRSKDVGVLGKIISGGIAAGTAGKVTDVSRTYETTFDETEFNQAVDEALVNSGLDRQRQDLLSALEEYTGLLQSSRTTLDELHRNADAEYRNTHAVELDIQPQLSGLTEYYTNDLNFRELVELVPKSTARSDRADLQAKKLLPCDARQCVRIAQSAIASVRANIERSRTELQSEGSYVYDVRCDKTSHAGYLLQMNCPDEITRLPSGVVPLPVSLNILARDFDDLYPNVTLRDEKLHIKIEDGEVTFNNVTSDYLTVTAQTVYYNGNVETKSAAISLAPGALATRQIEEFISPAIDVESSYRQMTPGKADSASFEFGFAARYRGSQEPSEKTLYAKREFNVGCVIENRVRPGSCVNTPSEEMQANKRAPVPF